MKAPPLMTEAQKAAKREYQRAWREKRRQTEAGGKPGKFKCEKCPASFDSEQGLIRHGAHLHKPRKTQRHKNNGTANPSAVLFCPKCGCNIHAVSVAMGL